MVSNLQVSQKILMGFILLSLITIVWTSYAIINNPYTFPAKFWLYFMTGFVTYIVILMIDNITNLELIKTFQYIVIAVSLLLNTLLIANIYTKYFTLPPNIITVIIALNGFMSGYILNYMLSFDPNKLKKTSTGTGTPSVIGTTTGVGTVGTTSSSILGTTGVGTVGTTSSSILGTTGVGTVGTTPSILGTTGVGTTTKVGTTTTGTVTMTVTKSPTGTITLTPTGTTTPISTLTTPVSPGVIPNIPQARSLNSDVYDFGAFDLSDVRSAGDGGDLSYYTDYRAQAQDEADLTVNYMVEADYANAEGDYTEADYAEAEADYADATADYAEADFVEADFVAAEADYAADEAADFDEGDLDEEERVDYDEGDYDEGDYDEGDYDEGDYDEGDYDEGDYDEGDYDEGDYDEGDYDEGDYDEGDYDD